MEERQDEQRQSAQPETPEKVNRAQQNRMSFDGPKLTFKRLPRVGDTLTLNGRVIGFCRAAQLGKSKGIDCECAIQGNEYAQAALLTSIINGNKSLFKMSAVHVRRSVVVAIDNPDVPDYPQSVSLGKTENGIGDRPGDNAK